MRSGKSCMKMAGTYPARRRCGGERRKCPLPPVSYASRTYIRGFLFATPPPPRAVSSTNRLMPSFTSPPALLFRNVSDSVSHPYRVPTPMLLAFSFSLSSQHSIWVRGSSPVQRRNKSRVRHPPVEILVRRGYLFVLTLKSSPFLLGSG